MPAIQDAINTYTNAFKAISDSARLDAEILIEHVTQLSRTTVFTHPEKQLTTKQNDQLKALAKRRLQGEPVAYITGHKAFWNLDLKVTPDVLIPRPETECLIEWILDHHPEAVELKIADLGVGSGAIALALAKERPNWTIHATDYSHQALHIAQENADKNNLHNVLFFHGQWCDALPEKKYDIIVSNPPYVESQDPHLNNLKFEPMDALDGGKDGLDDIKIIIEEAKDYLKKSGTLIFEHGYNQSDLILNLLNNTGYTNTKNHKDLAGLPRYCTAQNQ